MRPALFLSIFTSLMICTLAMDARAQFVWPRPGDHQHSESLYKEDPFITKYRQRFFSVFRGDFATFEKARLEIETMVKQNPKDARAMVWLGNAQTIEAGLAQTKNQTAEAKKLLELSRKTLDQAVALKSQDPNIYMMRAVTLFIQGQYFAKESLPQRNWELLRDDCKRFLKLLGPKLESVSVHVRGETYGELGIAYARLGDKTNAKKTFETLAKLMPGTEYERRANRELEQLKTS